MPSRARSSFFAVPSFGTVAGLFLIIVGTLLILAFLLLFDSTPTPGTYFQVNVGQYRTVGLAIGLAMLLGGIALRLINRKRK